MEKQPETLAEAKRMIAELREDARQRRTAKYRAGDRRKAAWHRGFDKGVALGLTIGATVFFFAGLILGLVVS